MQFINKFLDIFFYFFLKSYIKIVNPIAETIIERYQEDKKVFVEEHAPIIKHDLMEFVSWAIKLKRGIMKIREPTNFITNFL